MWCRTQLAQVITGISINKTRRQYKDEYKRATNDHAFDMRLITSLLVNKRILLEASHVKVKLVSRRQRFMIRY